MFQWIDVVDFQYQFNRVPRYIYIGLLVALVIGIIIIFALNRKKAFKSIALLTAIEYIIYTLCSTFLYRISITGKTYDFTPFWSYEAIHNGRGDLLAENIMNIILFIPIGLLLSCVSSRLKWWMVLLVGIGFSTLIELLQYIFKCGFSEFDDVFHNTLGCLIGIMIVAIIKVIWQFCSFLFVPKWGGGSKVVE